MCCFHNLQNIADISIVLFCDEFSTHNNTIPSVKLQNDLVEKNISSASSHVSRVTCKKPTMIIRIVYAKRAPYITRHHTCFVQIVRRRYRAKTCIEQCSENFSKYMCVGSMMVNMFWVAVIWRANNTSRSTHHVASLSWTRTTSIRMMFNI